MKSYFKLVHFEVNRFFKFYLILIGLTALSQLIGAIIISQDYMKNAKQVMAEQQFSMNQYIEKHGTFSFYHFKQSEWFQLPIFLCITVLMIYVFFIWYRDWFGKNTFIYRLLMLPTERITIYFAKLTAIMLLVLGLIALQIVLILLEKQIVNRVIPIDFQSSFSIYDKNSFEMWSWLYPNTFPDFILIYAVGLLLVAVVFTAILIERSYGFKGILGAILYGLLSLGVFFVPIFLANFYPNYFYPLEIFLLELVACIIVLGSAIWLANHLLKHKIRV